MEEQKNTALSTYSPAFGIRIKHPAQWRVEENIGFGGVQIFGPQDKNVEGKAMENISILVRPQANVVEINPNVLGYITNELIKSNYESFNMFILLNLVSREIDGLGSREMLFAYKDAEKKQNMGGLQVVFVKGNRLYLITYTAPEDRYTNYLSIVNDIIYNVELD